MTSTPAERRLTGLQRVAIALGPWVVRLLGATWRVRTVNEGPWRAVRSEQRGFVFALWHGDMLPLLAHHHDQGVKVLISEHSDGEVIARIGERLGFGTIRGSTTRGATRALLAMAEALRRGQEIAVTPDGPRGPRHTFASGTVVAAQRAGAPIVAVGVAIERAWRLRSWDAFAIPRPFSRVCIAYGDPVCVAAADARGAAEETPRFAREMAQATAAAEALLRGER